MADTGARDRKSIGGHWFLIILESGTRFAGDSGAIKTFYSSYLALLSRTISLSILSRLVS